MYRTPAAEIIPPSFCHITSFHGTSHLPSGSGNDCMHDCSHWVNHHSECPKIYSLFATPRAYGQLSTCGFWQEVDETGPHLPPKPVWRDQFTGAGRRTATQRTHNSKQTYSKCINRMLRFLEFGALEYGNHCRGGREDQAERPRRGAAA